MYSYRVEYKSAIDNNLMNSYHESGKLKFKEFIKSLGVGIKYSSGLHYRGYTILFEDEHERTLFLLKWG